jgi:hypothetical protein
MVRWCDSSPHFLTIMSTTDSDTAAPKDDAADADNVERPTASPLPGCLILIVVCVVFGILATLFTVVFFKQSRLIDGFTEQESKEVPQMEATPDQIQTANRKLNDVYMASLTNEMDRVLFSADDLNALIASKDLLADFRGQTYIHSISEEGIEAEMTQPLRSGFLRQGIRYLNGTFRLKPELTGKTVQFKVVDVDVEGKEVPDGFIASYPSFMKIDPKLEPFDQVIPKLGNVYIEGDQIVVETRVALIR